MTKKTILILGSFLFLYHNILLGQNSFEGIVEFKSFNRETNESSEVEWLIKEGNHKLTMNIKAGEYSHAYDILLKKNDPNIKMISSSNGKTFVFDWPPSDAKYDKPSQGVSHKLDETKLIAGYNCNLIEIVSPNGNSICWVSKEVDLSLADFPDFLKLNPFFGVLTNNQITTFPMQISTTGEDGELMYSMEVMKITTTTISSSEFELPDSYIDGQKAVEESFKVKE